MPSGIQPALIRGIAARHGFELAGIAAADPSSDGPRFQDWANRGLAGKMGYLTDHRASLRLDPKKLLSSARSILAVGKVYNGPEPYSTTRTQQELGWISRYAWGEDYHRLLREALEKVALDLRSRVDFEYRICVDTAPLLERSYARLAGLGWIGKNTCLISQQLGSWIFLGEMLLSLELEPDHPAPDRCGSCSRCIDACPTQAIVPGPDGWELDARLCISYFTIELRGPVPAEQRPKIGRHVFGCDICQDVCPWNRRAAITSEPGFLPRSEPPPLERLAELSQQEFKEMFRNSPVERARYSGFLRNVAIAMGNNGSPEFQPALRRLAASPDELVAEHARWALAKTGTGP
ncbi:MAG TPA: tRNA epoxyqueuosine(34) reductase QueG [Bryobacteraceae bacterium]|nr:tRNA epoxyqueuosine(34) reductase QueG [Bryobacteraceae bacterium]